jgi:hypothetical protein
MKLASLIVCAGALVTTAACNEPREGANGNLEFTPRNCGQVLSCDFDDSIGTFGRINITVDGLNGTPTAGLELSSSDNSVFTVDFGDDISGEPSWEIYAVGAGVAELVAYNGNTEVDFIEIPVQTTQFLGLENLVGDAVGPSVEDGYDEAWTVNAGEDVSFIVRGMIAEDAVTMGRFSVETVLDAGDTRLIDAELENSDRPNGYLSVNLPEGDYPVRFELTEDQGTFVEAIIHAVPPA